MSTLHERIWDEHVVVRDGGVDVLYVDLHLVEDVCSPQAFGALRLAGRGVRRPDRTYAVMDHNVSTDDRRPDVVSQRQLRALRANCAEFGIELARRRGISHVVAPESGLTLPGRTIACGDSHTTTHGALGALGIPIGTSEVEHVLATQTLRRRRPPAMRIVVDGNLEPGVTAKDVGLALIGSFGSDVASGYAVELAGPVVEALSVEARMTLCNLAAEAGATIALIAPDERTFTYLEGRPAAPRGVAWERALDSWRTLRSNEGSFSRELRFDVTGIRPQVTWGTNPAMVAPIDGVVPDPGSFADADTRHAAERALAYMGLEPGTPIEAITVDRVFIGSCTNARIEDLREAAQVVEGRRVHPRVGAIVVPGSAAVSQQAAEEGLDRAFERAGFEFRRPGCSLCLAMNRDVLRPGERCASTTNRNFEGRQGVGGRTHLVSPAVAAATAIAGRFVDPRSFTTEYLKNISGT